MKNKEIKVLTDIQYSKLIQQLKHEWTLSSRKKSAN